MGPVLIHVITDKGRGYDPSLKAADRMHGVTKFDPRTGTQVKGKSTVSAWASGSVHSALMVADVLGTKWTNQMDNTFVTCSTSQMCSLWGGVAVLLSSQSCVALLGQQQHHVCMCWLGAFVHECLRGRADRGGGA